MLAWILEQAGHRPGFLIGGVPLNFGLSARLGESPYFVVEADEYDTAFFDKRSKFVHYRPRTVVLNNLEYDHADIFPDLDAIKTQFHHLVRTIPGQGRVIVPALDHELRDVLDRGCWTPVESTEVAQGRSEGVDWSASQSRADGLRFDVFHGSSRIGTVDWALIGNHNISNALAAIAAAHHAGVDPAISVKALGGFRNVKRRMEIRSVINGVTIYDDFAHHPTAISATLQGLRAHVGDQRIIAVVELRSNTMRSGIHAARIPGSLETADLAIVFQPPGMQWLVEEMEARGSNIRVVASIDGVLTLLASEARDGDHLVFMSNGSFSGIYEKVEKVL
jgi:UDP-N-acetylmuramate: L-alanyl-gamma-D-glutamyl-meso-diaminopimelate ligase